MTRRALQILTVLLLGAAMYRVYVVGAEALYDDRMFYCKVAGVTLGEPLPRDPKARDFVNRFAPVNYEPHPGLNLPYIDYPYEYPPLSLPFFVLPRLLISSFEHYVILFAAEMLVLFALMGWMLRRISQRISERPLETWQIIGLMSAFALGAAWPLTRRFDAAPAAFAVAAVLATLSKRATLSGVLIGLGAATKLWPGFLLPVFLVADWTERDWRQITRQIAGAALGFILPHVPFLIAGGTTAFAYLGFHGQRGLQIESTWGNFAMLLTKLTPLESHVGHEYGSHSVSAESGWTNILTWLSYPAMVGVYALALLLLWRSLRRPTSSKRDRERLLVTACAAVILGLLATAKVLSMQFVVWLFPLVLVLPSSARGNKLRAGALLFAALVGVIFPHLYFSHLLNSTWPGVLTVFVRNIALVWILVEALRALKPQPEVVPRPALNGEGAEPLAPPVT